MKNLVLVIGSFVLVLVSSLVALRLLIYLGLFFGFILIKKESAIYKWAFILGLWYDLFWETNLGTHSIIFIIVMFVYFQVKNKFSKNAVYLNE